MSASDRTGPDKTVPTEVSQARYQRFFEHSKDFLYVTTEDGRFIEVNQAGVDMLGYASKDELLALDNIRALYHHPDDRDRLMNLAKAEGGVKDFETTLVRKDGRLIDVQITAVRWQEESGRAGMEGIIRDVTQLKRNFQDLLLCQQTTEGIIEATPAAIFVLDDRHQVTHWNQACETLTGISPDHIIGAGLHWRPLGAAPGRTMADLILDQNLEGLKSQYGDKNLRPSTLTAGGFMADDVLVGPEGQVKHLLVSAAPIADPSGQVQGAVQVMLDLSERVKLDRQLAASEAKYRRMIEQAWEGIVIHDHRSIFFVNPRFKEMFGLDPDQDLAGLGLDRFLAPETWPALLAALEEADLAGGGSGLLEGRGRRTDGTWFDLELSAVPTVYQGQAAVQTFIGDITRRKQMEERLINSERLAATGQLAFNLAHEINNPLGGIVTNAHLLLEDLDEAASPAQLAETVEKIIKLANRCKIIVGALLDFARPDREGLSEIDLNQVIDETLALLDGHLVMHGLTVAKTLDPLLPQVPANRTKMGQVFMNIIINAAEAMDGRGRLEIRTGAAEDHGVKVEISDTGRGIPEAHRKRLFEPFFSTKPRGRGTGLGLAISHGIVKQHGGTIEFESEVGRGTTFTIYLPLPK